ncbi:hypothetical protein HXX76_014381 [Chlamydomonas incerta]|uniref:Peptidase A1 domain-containing protein n=1 Tax=Chlamydomonas incerta TaxID=51695 RepID=A0A835SCB0_CHLIN|nr:hypothetical protein HXX76_014381 [Chlamydomonas incerta]|eukprot:KAG2424657.1 hypothetical protein HXX76_014381 [Chlamydomonas incerta]
MVPLKQRELEPSWRRHLLRSGYLPVQGSVREIGYFYTTLKLGTPERTFSVIIDTGSTITYIPCKNCAHCGKHTEEWFDPDKSTSAKKLACGDPLCNCGTPSCTCNNDRCYYSRTYAERSSSEGWMIEDTFGFPDSDPPVRLVFGCENGETGEIYRQMADGIMGMGNNHNAFQSQLVQRKVIEDVFSLCFGYPKDGILLLGDVAMPEGTKTVYTPLLTNLHLHYYNVKMEGITVDGQTLAFDVSVFDRGYGTVLDSGTTFTYLPTDAFKAMAKAVGDYVVKKGLTSTPGADPQYNDICWKGAPDQFKDLDKYFPPAEFVFGGGAKLTLPPLRYLFLSKPAEYCLGIFDNGNSGALVGGVSVRDVVVTYDRRNSKVGFTTMACADVARKLAERGTAAPNATVIKISPPPPNPPPPAPKPPSPASKPVPSPAKAAGGDKDAGEYEDKARSKDKVEEPDDYEREAEIDEETKKGDSSSSTDGKGDAGKPKDEDYDYEEPPKAANATGATTPKATPSPVAAPKPAATPGPSSSGQGKGTGAVMEEDYDYEAPKETDAGGKEGEKFPLDGEDYDDALKEFEKELSKDMPTVPLPMPSPPPPPPGSKPGQGLARPMQHKKPKPTHSGGSFGGGGRGSGSGGAGATTAATTSPSPSPSPGPAADGSGASSTGENGGGSTTPYHAQVVQESSGLGGYGLIIVAVVVVGIIIVAAELLVFRRHKLRSWLASIGRARGAQDETELAPLAGAKGILGGGRV